MQAINRRNIFVFLLLFCICHVQSAYSESYTLDVGESVTISQSAYGGGYIDNVGLADYIDPHLSFNKNYNGTATITVNSYFDYAATVKLVFIEKYTYLGHTRASTYYKDVVIKCKYQQPTPNKKPTKVSLPERIRIPVYNGGARDYIIPILEPYGAKGTEYYWYSDQGTAVFAARGQSDGSCWVTGRSPGVGRISVVVDDDWTNLIAHAVLEIVDPNNLPPNAVFLPSEIEISIGNHATIEPILVPENTSTSFTWKSDNPDVASVSYGKVTGVKEGTATISVVTANELTAICMVKVVKQNGRDDEEDSGDNHTGIVDGHEYVDLGLSVKWATCNVGASNPEDYGNYYAWGETNTKSTYTWDNYKYNDGDIFNLRYIGDDIKNTSYDVAHANWGTNWRLPTEAEAGELVSKCTFKEHSQNGIDGFLVTGPNGASIFFPKSGVKVKEESRDGCLYWTSCLYSKDDWYASALNILRNKEGIISPSSNSHNFRYFGLPIRAVSSVSSNIDPTKIELPSSKYLKVGEEITMSYTLTPSNANTKLTWSSDNTNIATVSSSGVVKGIKAGTTKIRVKTSNGLSDYCNVTVEESQDEWRDGDIFTAQTIEGVEMTFQVISAKNRTCSVGIDKGEPEWTDKGRAVNIEYNGAITIPSTIKGFNVVRIQDYAFWNCQIMSAVIPDGVSTIGKSAFDGCMSLISLTIPNSVTKIEDWALCFCSRLQSIILPNNLAYLGDGALQSCDAITTIIIPKSVTYLGGDMFDSNEGLTSIYVEWESPLELKSGIIATSQRDKVKLYVPQGTKALYKTAKHWNDFKEIIEYECDASDSPCLSVEGFTLQSADKAILMIGLTNPNDAINYVSFKLGLPNGLKVLGGEAPHTERTEYCEVESGSEEGYRYYIIDYGNIIGTEGPILAISVAVENNYTGGTIVVRDILLKTSGGIEYSQPNFEYYLNTDGIIGLAEDLHNASSVIFNLSGQRVTNPRKGIYLQNGKKVLVK